VKEAKHIDDHLGLVLRLAEEGLLLLTGEAEQ
jgi:hypothetical protein